MTRWAFTFMACPRTCMSARSGFRTSFSASRYGRDTVGSGIVRKVFERGGATWTSGDFGWRVWACERFERVWVTCLKVSHSHLWSSNGGLPPCRGVSHSQRIDHMDHHSCTSLSTLPPPHRPPKLNSSITIPDPYSIHTVLLWYDAHSNISLSR